MYRYIVAYDIPDDHTRKKVSDLLEGYGIRVQRSVFEIECKTYAKLNELQYELLKLIDQESDSIRFYFLCENCINKAFDLGNTPDPFDKEAIYFF